MKRCSKCGEVKPFEEFRRDRSKKLGIYSRCRECERQYGMIYHPKSTAHNQEYPLLRDRAWVEQQYSREYRSIGEIAKMVGCSYKTALRAIKQHQIPVIPSRRRRTLRARLDAQREGCEHEHQPPCYSDLSSIPPDKKHAGLPLLEQRHTAGGGIMGRNAGDNILTRNEDFTKTIPTRFPPNGVPTRRVSILEALEIAEEFYKTQCAHARNAEYCRARRARLDAQREGVRA